MHALLVAHKQAEEEALMKMIARELAKQRGEPEGREG